MRSGEETIDLRKCSTSIKDQWNGTCTTFAGVAAIEQKICKPYMIDLSERDSWHWYGKYSCFDFIDALTHNKICNEVNWPQNNSKPFTSCSDQRQAQILKVKYIKDDISASIEALRKGNPVYMGFTTPKDMLKGRSVIRPNSEASKGGHAILLVGAHLDDLISGGGYWIIKNSWGTNIGDSGYQYVPFSYCQRPDIYCVMWEIEEVEYNKSPYKYIKQCSGIWPFKRCKLVQVKS
jgi:C1A family cysteine protease